MIACLILDSSKSCAVSGISLLLARFVEEGACGGEGEGDGMLAGTVPAFDDVQAGVSAAFAYCEAEGWKLPDGLNAALDKVVNLGTIRAK